MRDLDADFQHWPLNGGPLTFIAWVLMPPVMLLAYLLACWLRGKPWHL